FLRCADCEALIHTARNQFDYFYYMCSNKKRKDEEGKKLCRARNMGRHILEPKLDELFSETLTDPVRLRQVYDQHIEDLKKKFPKDTREALEADYKGLLAQRERILEYGLKGRITDDEVDRRLLDVDEKIRRTRMKLTETAPLPGYTADELGEFF